MRPADPRLQPRLAEPTNPDCAAPTHGTYRDNHSRGCTCPEAVAAGRLYRKLKKAGKLPPAPERSVIAVGTARRLRALAVARHKLDDIAAAAGVSENHLLRIRSGEMPQVRRTTALAVAAVYTAWSRQSGTSKRVQDEARARGWCGPAGWDGKVFHIDDPGADDELAAATEGQDPARRRAQRDRARADQRARTEVLNSLPASTTALPITMSQLRRLAAGDELVLSTASGHHVRVVVVSDRVSRASA